MTIQIKDIGRYFPVVMSNDYVVQGGSSFYVCGLNTKAQTIG